ncbi:hypothetical protein SAPIO_CDS2702 [Scedosporium apiospermum]|uniref:NmrA-like domain-containing protein n=1 Tax=Pseudallescheria apiosperma TaxID=563466 RepID=A0A084GD20_PSEDA|nr:uncharacterized protein SAPIO_CDS2702 [Scedosporium apiospermum]KEZ45232.1 hypothetical protein SAPIO_CDS2702 [Scedosporium apiospermum]
MTSFKPSRILIFGATGQIGYFITEAILSANPAFPHVTIFTSENTASTKADLLKNWTSRGASVITGDVTDKNQVLAAYKDIDTVVSAVGRNVLDHQTNLLQWADEQENGSVKWFFPSEYGTDIEYGPKSATEKPHQLKLKVRKFAREQLKRVKPTYLVTGPYVDMYFTLPGFNERIGGFDVKNKRAILVEDGNGKVGFTTMRDVGKGVVAALKHPEASFDRAVKIQSFVVTPKEILAEFEKQTGGQPWKVEYTSLDDLRKLEDDAWKEGKGWATLATLRRIWAEGGTLYDKTDNEAIDLRDEDLENLETTVQREIAKSA